MRHAPLACLAASPDGLLCLPPTGLEDEQAEDNSAKSARLATNTFAYIGDHEPEPSQLALARKLIDNKTAPLNLSVFTDRYREAVLDLVKAKLAGQPPVTITQAQVTKVIDLMEALKRSVADTSKVNGRRRRKAPKAVAA